TMAGTGSTVVDNQVGALQLGRLEIDAPQGVTLDHRELVARGYVYWKQGVITAVNHAQIVTEGPGHFDVRCDGTLNGDATSGFYNEGQLVKSAGGGTTVFNIPLYNKLIAPLPGTVSVRTGTLELHGGGASSGGVFKTDIEGGQLRFTA